MQQHNTKVNAKTRNMNTQKLGLHKLKKAMFTKENTWKTYKHSWRAGPDVHGDV